MSKVEYGKNLFIITILIPKACLRSSPNQWTPLFWKGLMKVKDEFFDRGRFKVGNGENTSFWEYMWIDNSPLATQYPSLYNIV
jgi:hypothetical protein